MYHLDILLILTQYMKRTRLGVVYAYRNRYRALLRSRELADDARSIRYRAPWVACGQFDAADGVAVTR